MKDAPCIKCQDRYVGCHGDCDEYKEWKRELDMVRGRKFDEKQKDKVIQEFRFSNVGKTRRYSNQRKKRK